MELRTHRKVRPFPHLTLVGTPGDVNFLSQWRRHRWGLLQVKREGVTVILCLSPVFLGRPTKELSVGVVGSALPASSRPSTVAQSPAAHPGCGTAPDCLLSKAHATPVVSASSFPPQWPSALRRQVGSLSIAVSVLPSEF